MSGAGRTDEEREQARLERERRRAARDGAGGAGSTTAPDPAPLVEPADARPVPADAIPPTQSTAATKAATKGATRIDRQRLRERVAAGRNRAAVLTSGRIAPKSQDGSGETGAPRRRSRWLAPLSLLLVAVVGVAIWFGIQLYQPGKGAGSGRVAVTVPRGGSLGDIAHRLGSAGVVSSEFFFKLRARLGGDTSDLKPGVYVLHKDMAYGDVLTKLTAGPPRHFVTVTIPEGRARSEIAPLVKGSGLRGSYTRASVRSPLLDPHRYGARRGATLEGFLFPATYQLKRGAAA
ncbi:MAG: endolytic transglycosylase MltG, partial [Thermoleophilaceae bacterium]